MSKTITKVFVREVVNTFPMQAIPSIAKEFETSEDGKGIPGILVEYSDGDKLIIIAPEIYTLSFRASVVIFNLEEYSYNKKLDKWDRTDTGAFSNGRLTISNENLVDSITGIDKCDLVELVDDLDSPQLDIDGQHNGLYHKKEQSIVPEAEYEFIGEFDFWMSTLGKPVIIPPIQDSLIELFNKKH